jgi:hypothetical protein
MASFTPNQQIAAGHNNAAGLTLVSSLTDANGVKLVMPRALPFTEQGQLIVRPNASPAYRGNDTQDWEFSVLLLTQYYLLRTTYTGLVTVKVCIDGSTFADYNASAWIDEKTAGQYGYAQGTTYAPDFVGPALRGIRLHLILTEAL